MIEVVLPEVEPNKVVSELSIALRAATSVSPRTHFSPGGNSTYSIGSFSARSTSIVAAIASGAASSPGNTTTFLSGKVLLLIHRGEYARRVPSGIRRFQMEPFQP